MIPRALALVPPRLPALRVLAAEGRVRALLDAACALDDEVRVLRASAAAFDASWQRAAGAALAERDGALALARRLRRLEEELARLARGAPAAGARARAGPSSPRTVAPPGKPSRPVARAAPPLAPAPDVFVVEPEAAALKRAHRLLARALHPDLACDERDFARRSEWMAHANAAYHRRDLAGLELLAARAGAGPAPPPPDDAERLARLHRRELALSGSLDALRRERARLLSGEPLRLRDEAERAAAAGRDLAAETRAAASAVTATALEDAMERLSRLARDAPRVRAEAAEGSGLVRGPIDARAGARDGTRGGAVRLAAALADAARAPSPWEAAIALVAHLAEAGGTVPEGFATLEALERRWDLLRAGWPGAPALPRALSRLPRHVEVGLRVQGPALAAGLQLATAADAAALREALADPEVAALATRVLAVAGPALRCRRCDEEVFAVHLLRVQGLDEVHGLDCGRCGEALRTYVRYGEPTGVEALAPLAVELGLVTAVDAELGGRRVTFQVGAPRRPRLTAGELLRSAHRLLFHAHGVDVPAARLELHAGGRPLARRSGVPPGVLTIAVRAGGLAAEAAAAQIAESAARRFRG